MGAFEGERAVVVGAGVAGSAAARVLLAEGATVRVSESATARPGLSELRAEGIEVLEGGHAPGHLDGATLVVPSPGVPPRAEILTWARERGIPVWGEMELGARLARVPYLAVTGTNGKTTTTYIVEAMLRAAGLSPGVVGTVSYRGPGVAGGARPAPNTTPGALMLHELFAEMRAGGATDVVLEATSHALEQGRVEGCAFRVAAMTNLTQDHLDYHGDMQKYADAKAILFAQLIDPARGVAVTFVDDEAGLAMRARATSASARLGVARVPTAGADVLVERSTLDAGGTHATFATPVGRIEIQTPLVGDFNVENMAIAVGMAIARGLSADAIVRGAAGVVVPGRLEKVANDRGVLCVVDYAHTPDGFERAIAAMRAVTTRRLIVVFGCGGDRDRGKRPLMGEIAARGADLAIVTSDNPRTEDPAAIVDMILEGVRRTNAPKLGTGELAAATRGYHAEVDRRAAIRLAAAAAAPGDVLLIAGKGHEDYQIVGTTKHHFDDREEAAAALANAS
jgi:UDP-N-acetylmuramoyl-L-alanyl-D-glutamate--2,6-diaminopimelate ligase